MTKRIWFPLIFALVYVNAFGWGKVGHMIVAAIAYEKLDEEQRLSVTELLKAHPDFSRWAKGFQTVQGEMDLGMYLMMRASVWPDEIRSEDNPNHKFHRPDWHFISYELRFPNPTTTPETSVTPNVVSAINRAVDVVNDGDVEPEVRAMFLAWLIHLVGDLHQPLHCATFFSTQFKKGDMGGNLFWVAENGKPQKLHSLWDKSLSKSDEDLSITEIKKKAVQLLETNSAMPSTFDPKSISIESFNLSAQKVHLNGRLLGSKTKTNPPELPNGYVAAMEDLAKSRCLLGGKDLSMMLNKTKLFFEPDAED